jgi:hypothetical protein
MAKGKEFRSDNLSGVVRPVEKAEGPLLANDIKFKTELYELTEKFKLKVNGVYFRGD